MKVYVPHGYPYGSSALNHEKAPCVDDPDLQDSPLKILTFGYKYGVPLQRLTVMRPVILADIRKVVRNPWGVPELKGLTGQDKAVQEWIMLCKGSAWAFQQIYAGSCFGNADIFIGCTGGKHRSVAMAEMLAEKMRKNVGMDVHIIHRDINKK
jgi:UPF0042 nucleotide-binding protein